MLRSLALAGALALAGLVGVPHAATAASLPNQEVVGASASAPVAEVQYGYGRPGYGRGYGRPRYYGRPRGYGRRYYGGPRYNRGYYGPGPGFYGRPRGAYFGY